MAGPNTSGGANDQRPIPLARQFVLAQLGARAPAAVRARPGEMAGHFMDLDGMIEDFKGDHRTNRKLAVSITGGGPRGPYEAGAVEALLAAFRRHGVVPDIVTGACVGSAVAMCLFVDLLLPPSGAAGGPFVARQSSLWKSISEHNDGARRVLDKPWIIEYLSKNKRLPGISDIEAVIPDLEGAWHDFSGDLTALGPHLAKLVEALVEPLDIPTPDRAEAVRRLGDDAQALVRDGRALAQAWDALHVIDAVTDPRKFRREVDDVGNRLNAVGGDLSAVELDLLRAELGPIGDAIQGMVDHLGHVVGAAWTLLGDLGRIATDKGQLVGNLARLAIAVEETAVLLALALKKLPSVIINGLITDHVFENGLLLGLLRTFVRDAIADVQLPVSDGVRAWVSRGPKPAIYLAATDLSAKRQVVFALDDRDALEAIGREGTWVVDLASQQPASEYVMVPAPRMTEQDLLALAALTSGSLPFAFPPVHWYLDCQLRNQDDQGGSSLVKTTLFQTLVDGGVIDNSPIDLAVLAGATHIISLELTPFLDYQEAFLARDTQFSDLPTMLWRCFETAMDGGLLRSIDLLVALNQRARRRDRVQVYRMAPLIPREAQDAENESVTVSPGIIDFDGVYNDRHRPVMSLYDWFIQGYIDAHGYGASDEAGVRTSDPVLADYYATTDQDDLHDPWFGANRYWKVGAEPMPTRADMRNAGIEIPDRRALAETAKRR